VQDEVVTHMVVAITKEHSQKIDSAGDASLQKEVENVAEKEH